MGKQSEKQPKKRQQTPHQDGQSFGQAFYHFITYPFQHPITFLTMFLMLQSRAMAAAISPPSTTVDTCPVSSSHPFSPQGNMCYSWGPQILTPPTRDYPENLEPNFTPEIRLPPKINGVYQIDSSRKDHVITTAGRFFIDQREAPQQIDITLTFTLENSGSVMQQFVKTIKTFDDVKMKIGHDEAGNSQLILSLPDRISPALRAIEALIRQYSRDLNNVQRNLKSPKM